MTGGDYEDTDETIRESKEVADELFQVSVLGLRKSVNENYWDDVYLKPEELSPNEKEIMQSLLKNK